MPLDSGAGRVRKVRFFALVLLLVSALKPSPEQQPAIRRHRERTCPGSVPPSPVLSNLNARAAGSPVSPRRLGASLF